MPADDRGWASPWAERGARFVTRILLSPKILGLWTYSVLFRRPVQVLVNLSRGLSGSVKCHALLLGLVPWAGTLGEQGRTQHSSDAADLSR